MTVVSLDVFPARLDGPRGRVDGVRVLVADGRLLVFTRGDGRTVQLDSAVTVASQSDTGRGRRSQHTVTDTDGGEWTFQQNGSCGCSSPFKRLSQQALLNLAAP